MTNRYRLLYLVLGLLLASGATSVWAQPSRFAVDVVSAKGDAADPETRVDIYTQVPYADLQFVSSSNGFTAHYEITADVFAMDERGRRQNLVQSRIWEQTLVVRSFNMTQADKLIDRAVQSLSLRPGNYVLEMQMVDDKTGKAVVLDPIALRVRDMSAPVAVSDLILLEDYDTEQSTITPRVDNTFGTSETNITFFYELYAQQPARVRLTREVARLRKPSPVSTMRTAFGLGNDDEDGSEITYTKIEATALKAGRTQMVVDFPLNDARAGDYLVRVRVEDEAGQLLDMAEKTLTLRWSGLDDHLRNLDEAIAQLQYIAKDRDLSYIKEGPSEKDRLKRFMAFWDQRDPTPGTERNERMEEYYYRIDYANRKYGSLMSGWQTDRGHVLIQFGEPDFIERHPYSFDSKPYEIWYYDRIGRRFIFIDRTGLGDYELMIPIWDERTRIR